MSIQKLPQDGPHIDLADVKRGYRLDQDLDLILHSGHGVDNQDIFTLYLAKTARKEGTLLFYLLVSYRDLKAVCQFLKLLQNLIIVHTKSLSNKGCPASRLFLPFQQLTLS